MARKNSDALLPTGERMNPSAPETATYFDENQVAYIVRKRFTDKTSVRVLTSYGSLSDYTMGSSHEIHHDQALYHLGTFEVIGIVNYKTGEKEGFIPNRKLGHWVFK